MLELVPIKIESTLDWSLIVAIIGLIANHFGKLINEIKTSKENQYSNYVEGAFYIVNFILFPFLILVLLQNFINLEITGDLVFRFFGSTGRTVLFVLLASGFIVVQLLMNWFLREKFRSLELDKYNLRKDVHKLSVRATKQVLKNAKKGSIHDYVDLSSIESGWWFNFYWSKLSNRSLFALSLLNLAALTTVLSISSQWLPLLFSSYLAFLCSSLIAILVGGNRVKKYPKVSLKLKNGETLKGNLIKIGTEFTILLCGKKLYEILNEEVVYIKNETMKINLNRLNKSLGRS